MKKQTYLIFIEDSNAYGELRALLDAEKERFRSQPDYKGDIAFDIGAHRVRLYKPRNADDFRLGPVNMDFKSRKEAGKAAREILQSPVFDAFRNKATTKVMDAALIS